MSPRRGPRPPDIEQAAAIVRRQADGLAVAGHGGCLDELAVGRVGSAIAVDLQVGEQRPQGGQLAADGAVGLLIGGELAHARRRHARAGSAAGARRRPAMPAWRRGTGRGRAVGLAGMGGGGAEQPGIDRPADGLAEIAGHLAGKGRDRVGVGRVMI